MDNEDIAKHIRSNIVNVKEKKVLISKIKHSLQENDITLPINCDGFGRIRHFRMYEHDDWVFNPLPNLPSCKSLNVKSEPVLKTQVFQIAGCNWNCWYCFVDDELKVGNPTRSKFISSNELVNLYLKEKKRQQVIVLSGGQPDLAPEWIYWMIEALSETMIDNRTYLWSDDNLSTDYYFRYLTKDQRDKIASYENYGKVGCFKGFDDKSFVFNTNAPKKKFNEQFDLFDKIRLERIDLYGYVTFTSPLNLNLGESIDKFFVKLSDIHDKLPLRVVPLKIIDYSPSSIRMSENHRFSLKYQHEVLKTWKKILEEKYTIKERMKKICEIVII